MDSFEYLDIESIGGIDLYQYCNNNPVMYDYNSPLFNSCSLNIPNNTKSLSKRLNAPFNNPWWLTTTIEALPDFALVMKYMVASGMHKNFAYATKHRYMFPIMDGTWRWFGKTEQLIESFGRLSNGAFKQILTGDSKAKISTIVKSLGNVALLNLGINFAFNFIENDFQCTSEMLKDTFIDTAIGVSSYYLAAGSMSLITAGLLTAGVTMPGIVVVGGVIVLSIGFEHVIRAIFDYWQ